MKTLLLAAAMAFPAAAQMFTVAGIVTDGLHNSPLERARVFLAGEGVGMQALTTAADGRFTFRAPQGTYHLYADRNGWRTQFGDSEPPLGFGSAVITGPGQDTSHLTLRWYPPGSISGRVVDEQNEPVRDATVYLICDAMVGGRKRVLETESAETDDLGQYRFGPLAAGSYYIVATGKPWFAAQLARSGLLENGASQPAMAYPATYYPGTTDARSATPIALKSGAEVQADLSLRTTTAATVSIHCPGSGVQENMCPGGANLYLLSIGGIEIFQSANPDPGTDTLSGVPPGRYVLRFMGAEKTAHRVIDVAGGDLSIDLSLQPYLSVTGEVVFKGHPPKAGASVYISMRDESTDRSYGAAVSADGRFEFPNFNNARYRPTIYGSAGLVIEQISVDGAPLKDGVIDLTGSAAVHIKILASDETGRVKGLAKRGDQPAPAVLIVLAPQTASANPSDYLGYQTESDGSFDYVNVPAGDYLLIAIDRLDLEYTNPEVLRPYLPAATRIQVPAHGVIEQQVEVSAAPKD